MRYVKYLILILPLLFPVSIPSRAQSQTLPKPKTSARIAIRAAKLLDVNKGILVENPTILIDGEKIIAVGSNLNVSADTQVIDLGNATILPGLIDSHRILLIILTKPDILV